jgi:hypothetical protein
MRQFGPLSRMGYERKIASGFTLLNFPDGHEYRLVVCKWRRLLILPSCQQLTTVQRRGVFL